MIKLEKMSVKQPELDLIAEWRNQSMISLRSTDLTAKGQSQIDWVNSFGAKEKYYFIYDPGTPSHNTIGYTKPAFVGYCGLDKIDSVNRTAEMGLLINPEYHKKGYGSVAVRKLLKMAFEQFNLNCIFIEVIGSTNNWDFWLKQGFFHEGSLRARHYKNGVYYQYGVYYQSRVGSILKSEWSKANGN
jgi:RimJ/RimL family protein N-acetyltransferase